MIRLWHQFFGHRYGALRGHGNSGRAYADGSFVRYCPCGEREIVYLATDGRR